MMASMGYDQSKYFDYALCGSEDFPTEKELWKASMSWPRYDKTNSTSNTLSDNRSIK